MARRRVVDDASRLPEVRVRPLPPAIPLRAPAPVYDMRSGDNVCSQCGHTGWNVGRHTATCVRCNWVVDLPAGGRAFDHGFRSDQQ